MSQTPSEAFPQSTRRSVALGIVIFALILGSLSATIVYDRRVREHWNVTYWATWVVETSEWLTWAAFIPLLLFIDRQYGFRSTKPFVVALLIHTAVALVFILVQNGVLVGLARSGPFADGYYTRWDYFDAFRRRLYRKLPLTPLVYAFLVAGSHIIRNSFERQQRLVRDAQLEARLAEASLHNLQLQLQPHFLFNALNTISGLVRDGDRTTAVNTIAELSDLLRRSLRDCERQVVTLAEELEFIEAYMRIQQARWGDRVAVAIDAPDDLRNATVPTLVLQPLVENAVRHGFERQPGTGLLQVRVRRDGGKLVLSVLDNGPGFDALSPARTGMGLNNTMERLRHLYGENASIEWQNRSEGGALVTVTLPYAEGQSND